MHTTYKQALSAIQDKTFSPVYFVQGPNIYQMDSLIAQLETHALTAANKSFNLTKVYAKDLSLAQILLQAKRIPINAPRQVIIVKEAQTLRSLLHKQQHKLLVNYLQHPVTTTILVFLYKHKTLPQHNPLTKAFLKDGILVTTKLLYDREIPTFLINYLKPKGCTLTEEAMRVLQLYIGNNQQLLTQTLDKLLLKIPKNHQITVEDVKAQTGISREYDLYALQRALGKRDTTTLSHILTYFNGNPKAAPLPLVITLLYQFYTKLLIIHQLGLHKDKATLAKALAIRPFWIPEYLLAAKAYPPKKIATNIGLLHEADRAFKGVIALPMPETTQLQYLVQRLL